MPTRKTEQKAKLLERRKGLTSNRPRKLKTWSKESMSVAINAVRDLPSTLKVKISGRVNLGPSQAPFPT